MDQTDLFAASKALVSNYCAEFPLFAEELDVLFDLIRMRLTVSVAMSSHQIKAHPENEYLLVSQKPALELLDRLDDIDPQFMTALFRHAAGHDAVDHASDIISYLEQHQPEVAPCSSRTLSMKPGLSSPQTAVTRPFPPLAIKPLTHGSMKNAPKKRHASASAAMAKTAQFTKQMPLPQNSRKNVAPSIWRRRIRQSQRTTARTGRG